MFPAWDQRFLKGPKDSYRHVPIPKALWGELSQSRGYQLKAMEENCPYGVACSSPQGDAVGTFHVLLPCSTLWYCACGQLAPLPRFCFNTFPSHTLRFLENCCSISSKDCPFVSGTKR